MSVTAFDEDGEAIENLARYIIRASFLQERMTYVPEKAQVIYRSKDGKEEKVKFNPHNILCESFALDTQG